MKKINLFCKSKMKWIIARSRDNIEYLNLKRILFKRCLLCFNEILGEFFITNCWNSDNSLMDNETKVKNWLFKMTHWKNKRLSWTTKLSFEFWNNAYLQVANETQHAPPGKFFNMLYFFRHASISSTNSNYWKIPQRNLWIKAWSIIL